MQHSSRAESHVTLPQVTRVLGPASVRTATPPSDTVGFPGDPGVVPLPVPVPPDPVLDPLPPPEAPFPGTSDPEPRGNELAPASSPEISSSCLPPHPTDSRMATIETLFACFMGFSRWIGYEPAARTGSS